MDMFLPRVSGWKESAGDASPVRLPPHIPAHPRLAGHTLAVAWRRLPTLRKAWRSAASTSRKLSVLWDVVQHILDRAGVLGVRRTRALGCPGVGNRAGCDKPIPNPLCWLSRLGGKGKEKPSQTETCQVKYRYSPVRSFLSRDWVRAVLCPRPHAFGQVASGGKRQDEADGTCIKKTKDVTMKIINKPIEQSFPIRRQCCGCKTTLDVSENELKLVRDNSGFTVAFLCPVCGDENAADVTYEYKKKFIAQSNVISKVIAFMNESGGTP